MRTEGKYPRSLHAKFSLGTTSDDRFMPEGYVKVFSEFDSLVITEKLDGQNDCIKKEGVFARSHTSPTIHPWDAPIRQRWSLIKDDLGDLEIFGENMYGIHSIEYESLESYFYVFAVREKGVWLSWAETCFWAEMFGFPTVPVLSVSNTLPDYILTDNPAFQDIYLLTWLEDCLGKSWIEYTNGSGVLGGFDVHNPKPASEGFVVRNIDAYAETRLPTAENELDNLFKVVRPKHVGTDVHWSKTWKPAKLIDYEKYYWNQYSYLSR